MKTNTNKKHIINPEKKLGVEKKQYRNGYRLYTYIHENDCVYKFVTVDVGIFYTSVICTLYDVNPSYQCTRQVQKYDFWNF